MASKTVPPSARLECLAALCRDLAAGINSARTVLQSNAEDADVAHLVSDALGRLGAMADRATLIAHGGTDLPVITRTSDQWIFADGVASLLAEIETGKVQETAHG